MDQVEHPVSRKYFLGALASMILGTVFYLVVLSPNGIIVKQELEERKARFAALVAGLEEEGVKLKEKYDLLKDDETALATEAKKYLLLDSNAQILRFIEPKTPTLASHQTPTELTPKKTSKNSQLENVRLIYKIALTVISLVLLAIAIRKRLNGRPI